MPRLWRSVTAMGLTAACAACASAAPPVPPAPLRLEASETTFVRVRGVAIHYAESRPATEGEPWLLLLHGFGASTESWYDVAPLLAPAIRVVRIDLRGFGLSSKPRDANYSLEEQAAIVIELLPLLGKGPVVIGGHSYGGAVTFITYLRLLSEGREGAVRGLILMDAPTYPQKLPFFISSLRNPFTRFISQNFTSYKWRTRFVLERVFFKKELVDDARVERYARALERDNAEYAIAAVAKQVVPGHVETLPDSLKLFDVPTLIIWGEHDPVVPIENARRLNRDIRGSELVVVPGTGHVPHEELPALTANAMIAFLKRL